ncbi:transposase [Vibrio vulnificus]|uniref:Mu transposase C-terminal domain-containing protein n=1 Tax=Vibrio vulnificus TaxID=672 RepID=UPI001029B2AC|nr:Mu transposase C-terminal domain-containing protein [Vibrio vulnificus]MDF5466790.1 Mu transposase C-terminal domain-containing protein [Vibrio parahaemolyticus]MDF5499951.1 Mu transposase C-terminal domain-containing protein [Vibrio parahaemolyticus]MDF5510685.1 Mu transposase C-terminal domain-containing protein [Vibrio parahaemolyticus]MDF5558393.1 Mu transposase C-terminal domain-containing protein [Vibrio parahaemolyticus]RZP73462.1 transposase [Vibrio vulnificus]
MSFGPFKDEFGSITDEVKQQHDASPEAKLAHLKYASLTATKVIERDLSSFPEDQKQKALERYRLISLIAKEIKGGWTPKNLNPLIDKNIVGLSIPKPSDRTVKRWYKAFCENNGDIKSLVDSHHLKGNRQPRVYNDEPFFIEAVERFLDAVRPSYAKAYRAYEDLIEIENSTIVSGKITAVTYQAFKERLKKLPPYTVALKRHGKYYADKLFNYYESVKMPTRILERVEIDHTPLDLILLDDELLIPLGRAYLTLLVDVFSGCIIGFHLGFKAPSYISVSKAIIHSVKTKAYVNELPIELGNQWLCHGKIENLVVDNGAEFWSNSLDQACTEGGINIIYNKVRRPWLKPFVERKFGELIQGIVGWIPGKTFSNVLEKEDYDPQKDAVMRFGVFVEELHRWIIDVHNASADSRNTRIPNCHWQKSEDVLPPPTLSESDEKKFRVIMGLFDKRTLTSQGIKYKHLMYDNVALEHYRKQYPLSKDSKMKTIKIDPDDLSRIFVFLDEMDGYIEVPCKYDPLGYTNKLSLCEHIRTVKVHRDFIKGQVDSLSLAKARQALHERIKLEHDNIRQMSLPQRSKKAKNGKKMAELAGVNSDSPKSITADYQIEESIQPSESTPVDDLQSLWNKRRALRKSNK